MRRSAIADDAAAALHTGVQWLVFRCAGDDYGMRLDRVREIVPPRPLTRLPGTGPEVGGLAGLRGSVVTVLDLGVLLAGRGAVTNADHRLLLLDVNGRRLGAAVDEVVTIAPAVLHPGPGNGAPGVPGSLGTGRTDDGSFVALEPSLLLERLLP